MAVAPCFLMSLIGAGELSPGTDVWQDTEIPQSAARGRHLLGWPVLGTGNWSNTFIGESVEAGRPVRVGGLLARFPA
jgi:hypothetical protein